MQELLDAYAEAIRTSGPRPKWVMRFGGPVGAFPGDSSSVTQYLEPGSYVWICPIEDNGGNPHFGKREVKPFVVRASNGATADRTAGPRRASWSVSWIFRSHSILPSRLGGTRSVSKTLVWNRTIWS